MKIIGKTPLMRLCLACVVATGVLALPRVGSPTWQNRDGRANVGENTVQVLVLGLNGAGQPILGLTPSELTARIGGKQVEVKSVHSLKDEPLIFSMIVDESGSTRMSSRQQTSAAIWLFRALSNGANHGYLVLFNEEPNASNGFLDPQAAEQVLRRATPRGSTALYDAIVVACTEQLKAKVLPPNSRRAILLFTDGSDNVSRHSLEGAVRTAQKAGVPIFSIKIRVDEERPKESKREYEILRALSEGTGGLVILPNQQPGALENLPNVLGGQFLLTLGTEELQSKKAFALRVEATAKDIQVLAPSEYVAP